MLVVQLRESKEIMLYCGKNGSNIFTSKDFDILCDQIGILPYGLTYTEKQILQALNHCGSATLTGLAAKMIKQISITKRSRTISFK